MKKKLTALIMALSLAITLVGCSSGSTSTPAASTPDASASTPAQSTPDEPASDFPNRAITWVVPWNPGGANDVCARLIAPELEKVLGVPVTITNTNGAGGWIGYDTLLAADPDGYTISSCALPAMVSNYINPEAGRTNTYKDFAPLTNFARDYCVLCIKPDETRFSTFEEAYEYSKTNELMVAGVSGPGDDGILLAQLNMMEDCQFVQMGTGGSSESLTNLYGGHTDMAVANVGDVLGPIAAGQLKVVAVAAEERISQLPDVPTIKEVTGQSIIADSSRGIVAAAGVPEAELTVLRDALAKCFESEDLKTKLADIGVELDPVDWKGYEAIMQDAEDMMYELGPVAFGWDVKKP